MKESLRQWRDWGRAAVFPLIVAGLAEARMTNELVYRWHSYFLTSVHHKGNAIFYIISMILIPASLLISVLEFKAIEGKMRRLGADDKAIDSLRRAMASCLGFIYLTFAICLGSIIDLLPTP